MTGASAVCNDEVHYVMPEMHYTRPKMYFAAAAYFFWLYIKVLQ